MLSLTQDRKPSSGTETGRAQFPSPTAVYWMAATQSCRRVIQGVFGGSKALEPHFDPRTFNLLWLTSASFWIADESTIWLTFAASTVFFEAKVLHLVRSHEITRKAEMESLSASISRVERLESVLIHATFKILLGHQSTLFVICTLEPSQALQIACYDRFTIP